MRVRRAAGPLVGLADAPYRLLERRTLAQRIDRVTIIPRQLNLDVFVICFIAAPIQSLPGAPSNKRAAPWAGPLPPAVSSRSLGLAYLVQLGKAGALEAEVADDAAGLLDRQAEVGHQRARDPAAALLPG